jgi:hypothetical protein
MTPKYINIIRLIDMRINGLLVVAGLLVWVATGCLVCLLFEVMLMATGLLETIAMCALAALLVAFVAPPFIVFGYSLIYMGITATFQKVLEQKPKRTNTAYLIYSTVLDTITSEPLVDIFIASDRIKAEELFLAENPNAVGALIKSEVIDTGFERAEGVLEFNLEDDLYWELWDLVGDKRILGIIKEVEANSES